MFGLTATEMGPGRGCEYGTFSKEFSVLHGFKKKKPWCVQSTCNRDNQHPHSWHLLGVAERCGVVPRAMIPILDHNHQFPPSQCKLVAMQHKHCLFLHRFNWQCFFFLHLYTLHNCYFYAKKWHCQLHFN